MAVARATLDSTKDSIGTEQEVDTLGESTSDPKAPMETDAVSSGSLRAIHLDVTGTTLRLSKIVSLMVVSRACHMAVLLARF